MRDHLIISGYLAGVAFLLSVGLLMATSPKRSRRFLDWLTRADRWSHPNPDWKPGLDLEGRIAGAAMSLLAIYMGASAISLVLGSPGVTRMPAEGVTGSPDWGSLCFGVAMLASGLYLSLEPGPLLRWGISKMPHRIVLDETSSKWRKSIRFIGAMCIAIGAAAIYAWLRSVTGR